MNGRLFLAVVTGILVAFAGCVDSPVPTLPAAPDTPSTSLVPAEEGTIAQPGLHETPSQPDGITYEEAQEIERSWEASLRPDLLLSAHVDKVLVHPNEEVTFSIRVTNVGTGVARSIRLINIFPNGTVITQDIIDLAGNQSLEIRYPYRIPDRIATGTVLVDSARVVGENLIGQPEDQSNNGASVSITVQV
jgi:uncharacterized repeat protein (TIGR01451 family)